MWITQASYSSGNNVGALLLDPMELARLNAMLMSRECYIADLLTVASIHIMDEFGETLEDVETQRQTVPRRRHVGCFHSLESLPLANFYGGVLKNRKNQPKIEEATGVARPLAKFAAGECHSATDASGKLGQVAYRWPYTAHSVQSYTNRS
ncbi:hypothetical protein LXL04_029109 [Taraxacum kok-saghyz]